VSRMKEGFDVKDERRLDVKDERRLDVKDERRVVHGSMTQTETWVYCKDRYMGLLQRLPIAKTTHC